MTANRMLIYFRAHTPGVFVEGAEDQSQGLLNVWPVFFLLLSPPQPLSINIMNCTVLMLCLCVWVPTEAGGAGSPGVAITDTSCIIGVLGTQVPWRARSAFNSWATSLAQNDFIQHHFFFYGIVFHYFFLMRIRFIYRKIPENLLQKND